MIIAGAQAVYLHAGASDLALAPFTTDADLAINPKLLQPDPRLEAAMTQAGFQLGLGDGPAEPGMWMKSVDIDGQELIVPADLIVPEGAATGGGRRGARLGLHGKRAAHRAAGLESALIDHSPMQITALEPGDERVLTANVAGAAALLVAKVHKIHDRLQSGRADRLVDKDASDVLRLMQTTTPTTIGATLATLAGEKLAAETAAAAVDYLEQLFGRRGPRGVEMAVRAVRLTMPAARVEAICTAYIDALLPEARRTP